MYKPDKYGRIFLSEESFLAPFGHFEKDWKFLYNFISSVDVGPKLLHDGMDFNLALSITETQIKNHISFIGFHKGERSAYIILEQITEKPIIYVLHGGINRKLYGSGLPQKALDFVKQFVFDEKGAEKLEGIIMAPNKLLEGYFRRGGLTKECEIVNRISVDNKLFPIKIFGMTSEVYNENKEKDDGRKSKQTTSRSKSRRGSTSTNRRTKKRTRKACRRKKHKRK